MKRRKPLPIPQSEFGFTPDTFNLFREGTADGERLARDRALAEHERQLADREQNTLFQTKR